MRLLLVIFEQMAVTPLLASVTVLSSGEVMKTYIFETKSYSFRTPQEVFKKFGEAASGTWLT